MKSKSPPPLPRRTLQGVWSALILPWTRTDRLDERRFRREVRSYAGGTTGEFHAQDDVKRVIAWCRRHPPELLPPPLAR